MREGRSYAPPPMDEQIGQPAARAYTIFTDQHGREWGAETENKTRHAVGFFEPRFKAPWYPPQKYVRHNPQRASEVVIHYDELARDIRQAEASWREQIRFHAVHNYGQGAVDAMVENPSDLLLSLAGQRPAQRIEPVLAAAAGNRWILGFTEVKPKKAADFFPERPVRRAQGSIQPLTDVEDPFADEITEELAWGLAAPKDEDDRPAPGAPLPQPAPGVGLWYVTYDGHKLRGSKEEAQERVQALDNVKVEV